MESKPLVPRLRFPEFQEAPGWKRSPLDKLATIVNEKVPVASLAVENYVSTENLLPDYGGVSPAASLPAAGSVTRYRSGDVLISNIRPYLKKVWRAHRDGGASNDVIVLRSTPTLSRSYLSLQLANDAFITYLARGAKGVKMPRGDVDSMRAYPIAYPEPAEQEKIAECLTSLDELIVSEGRKLEALRAHKKGLIQNLFPREGETTPRLRFRDFRDAGTWEHKPLNELLYEAKRRNRDLKYSAQDVLSVSGEHGCINQIELLGRSYAGASVKEYHVVETGDVVYTKSPLKRNPFGIIKANKGTPGIVSTLYAVYRTREGCDADFLDRYFSNDYRLNTYLQPIVRKGAKNDMKVNNLAVLGGNVCVPLLDEQLRIASCLSSLDTLITDQATKLDALKTHKQGLMQNLFPSPEEPA